MASMFAKHTCNQNLLEARFLGRSEPYNKTLKMMHHLHQQVCLGAMNHQLMLLEHRPVITLTRQHLEKSLLSSKKDIEESGIEVTMADRGGDATFHGPGQLVGYPIIAIKKFPLRDDQNQNFIDLSAYIRTLEKSLMAAMHDLGLSSATLLRGYTGVWVKYKDGKKVELKKLIAIGVGVKDGTTKHGFALNIDIDYRRFLQHMIPCGLSDRTVITLLEAFRNNGLEMPAYSVIVHTISQCLAKYFSLTLKWHK